jgi:hypothetical protein
MKELVIALIVLLVLAFIWYNVGGAEKMTDWLDQMANVSSDPTYFKYMGWVRDPTGMAPRDYYVENEMNYLNQISPGYFVGDKLFTDHTDFLGMPPQYRPKVDANGQAMSPASTGYSQLTQQYHSGLARDVNQAYTWQ